VLFVKIALDFSRRFRSAISRILVFSDIVATLYAGIGIRLGIRQHKPKTDATCARNELYSHRGHAYDIGQRFREA
jgi:hypothetical protein